VRNKAGEIVDGSEDDIQVGWSLIFSSGPTLNLLLFRLLLTSFSSSSSSTRLYERGVIENKHSTGVEYNTPPVRI